MNSWVVLLAIIAQAANCYAQENTGQGMIGLGDSIAPKSDRSAPGKEDIDDHEDYGLHVVNPGRIELYKYFEQMTLAPSVKDCEEWSHDDSRTGMLFSISGTSRLFIGKRRDTEQRADDAKVDQIEKNYDVTSVTIGGTPLEGSVIVTLPGDFRHEGGEGMLREVARRANTVGSPKRRSQLPGRCCGGGCTGRAVLSGSSLGGKWRDSPHWGFSSEAEIVGKLDLDGLSRDEGACLGHCRQRIAYDAHRHSRLVNAGCAKGARGRFDQPRGAFEDTKPKKGTTRRRYDAPNRSGRRWASSDHRKGRRIANARKHRDDTTPVGVVAPSPVEKEGNTLNLGDDPREGSSLMLYSPDETTRETLRLESIALAS